MEPFKSVLRMHPLQQSQISTHTQVSLLRVFGSYLLIAYKCQIHRFCLLLPNSFQLTQEIPSLLVVLGLATF